MKIFSFSTVKFYLYYKKYIKIKINDTSPPYIGIISLLHKEYRLKKYLRDILTLEIYYKDEN